MASSKEKFEQDAQRAKSRSFAGYLKDRATGSADFDKSDSAVPTASAGVMGSKNSANAAAMKEAGFKRGGAVRAGKSAGFKW